MLLPKIVSIGQAVVALDERKDLTFKIWRGKCPLVVVYLTNGPTLVCGGSTLLEALEHSAAELANWPEWSVNGNEPEHTRLSLTVWTGSATPDQHADDEPC